MNKKPSEFCAEILDELQLREHAEHCGQMLDAWVKLPASVSARDNHLTTLQLADQTDRATRAHFAAVARNGRQNLVRKWGEA